MNAPTPDERAGAAPRAPDDREAGEKRFETFLGDALRAGVLLAATVVLFGGALYLIRHGGERPRLAVFVGEPVDLRRPAAVLDDALRFRARGIIQLGLLLLVATPVVRVALSAFGFWREGDRTYVALTLLVLAGLVYSLVAGGWS